MTSNTHTRLVPIIIIYVRRSGFFSFYGKMQTVIVTAHTTASLFLLSPEAVKKSKWWGFVEIYFETEWSTAYHFGRKLANTLVALCCVNQTNDTLYSLQWSVYRRIAEKNVAWNRTEILIVSRKLCAIINLTHSHSLLEFLSFFTVSRAVTCRIRLVHFVGVY